MAPITITIALRRDDAEPLLRQAARDAAFYGGLCDHIGSRTRNAPTITGESIADARQRWGEQFRRAKRIVEAFGVEIEPTSEPETLTVEFDYTGGKREIVKVGDLRFARVTGSKPDYKHPRPAYRRDVHAEASRQAADRVVRRWRAT